MKLQWDVFVPDDKIRSMVTGGFVTLTGEVDTYAQRDDAARGVRYLSGVRGVLNLISVSRADVTPAVLRSAIQSAIERHADRDAAKIKIDVKGGHVTLHGDVHSWIERQAILGAVTERVASKMSPTACGSLDCDRRCPRRARAGPTTERAWCCACMIDRHDAETSTRPAVGGR